MFGVRRRIWLVAFALALTLAAASQTIDDARSAAECLVRAEYELILCSTGPSPWVLPGLGLAIVLLSVAVGIEMGSSRARTRK